VARFVEAPDAPRSSTTQAHSVASVASCRLGATSRRASSLSQESSGDCPDANDDPSLVIQDMDLFSSLALKLSHAENPTPDGFKVGCQMTLPR
jgi:hypothetical protein